MISANWTRENIAWLAGIIEGEGCITGQTASDSATVIKVSMTDEDVIRKAHRIAGCGTVYGPRENGERNKPVWCWSVSKAKYVFALAVAIFPFMCERRTAKLADLIQRSRMHKWMFGRRHGTVSSYRGGCKCEPCTAAVRAYNKAWWRANKGKGKWKG